MLFVGTCLASAAPACSAKTSGATATDAGADAASSDGGTPGSGGVAANGGSGGSAGGGDGGNSNTGGTVATGGGGGAGGLNPVDGGDVGTGGAPAVDSGAPQCSGSEIDCAGNVPRRCNGGRWDSLSPCTAPTSECEAGTCIEPNCRGLARLCGDDQSCCETAAVPATPFLMGRSTNASSSDYFPAGDADETPEHTATSIGVTLDVFEVTVARFRAFHDAYPASKPRAGAGAHPGIPNSGWDSSWDSELPTDQFDLRVDLLCSNRHTFSDTVIPADDQKPINCLNWYVAFAFCAWDGGFLPTEADWEAAAAGGSENRLYPWQGAAPPDATRASFDCTYDGGFSCEFTDIPPVGSLAAGRGRYGHHDLAGSMEEFVLDGYDAAWYGAAGQSCTNCANLVGTERVTRGGSWQSAADDLRVARRTARDPSEQYETYGVRCAR